MIEFKRAGDVMVFECPSFKIEVCSDAERIEFADILHDPIDRVTDAFQILDMMLEYKTRQTHVLNFGVDMSQGEHMDVGTMRKRFGPNYTYCGAAK